MQLLAISDERRVAFGVWKEVAKTSLRLFIRHPNAIPLDPLRAQVDIETDFAEVIHDASCRMEICGAEVGTRAELPPPGFYGLTVPGLRAAFESIRNTACRSEALAYCVRSLCSGFRGVRPSRAEYRRNVLARLFPVALRSHRGAFRVSQSKGPTWQRCLREGP